MPVYFNQIKASRILHIHWNRKDAVFKMDTYYIRSFASNLYISSTLLSNAYSYFQMYCEK